MSELGGVRAAYVAYDPFPNRKGSGTRIAELCSGLVRAGAEVTLLTLPPTSDDAPPEGVTLRPIRVAEDNYLCRVLSFAERVGRELVALRPDVIHFRGAFEGQVALGVAASLGARTLFEVNGLPSVELRYHYPTLRGALDFERKLRALEACVLAQSDAVITQSQATLRFLRLRGLAPERGAVIPNGANLPNVLALSTASALRLFYAGTLAPWQGLGDLLQALARLQGNVDFELSVVGWGQKRWRRGLERRARRAKISERVCFETAVTRSSLAERIAHSDICLAPMPRDRRNRVQGASPIKLFEYMAAGRAVLATDLPCLREIVSHGETGLLARPSHPRELAESLAILCGDAALRARLGAAARRRIETSATWEHRRSALVECYRELLVQPGLSRPQLSPRRDDNGNSRWAVEPTR